ncbi:hypothetical protein [Paenibacillus aquistagni]|uniref:hypothetical protein n=1 Tax=Paenibacillus aquistagni TaxID=1852522 RepID=UPI00145B6872|nr:hypothetical protein [Paenibacillus aquistagni]NMM53779.1 hypothetical protein [Paenibacillus aquistagni]
METNMNKYLKYALVLLLSVGLILFTQQMKIWFNGEAAAPISAMTFYGLITLWTFAFLGVLLSDVMKKVPVRFLQEFPVLGWVSIISLVCCLMFEFPIKAIQAVDFLSITTPVLTFAGISVANRLVDLRRTSWRVGIVAIFVFLGTYLGSALLSELGLAIAGK